MTPHDRNLLLVVVGLMLGVSINARLDSDSSKKLKDNWTKFVQSLLTPDASCYKTIADYGTIEVTEPKDETCDVRVARKGTNVCVKVKKGAPYCKASMLTGQESVVKIELTDPVNFCSDSLSSLHMLLHSTNTYPRHGITLPTLTAVPRHMFVDPLVRMDSIRTKLEIHNFPAAPPLPPRDWPHRAAGGLLLMDRHWQPRHFGHRPLAAAADPRHQADLLLQWMTSPVLTENVLSPADSVLLGQTSCATLEHCSGQGQSASCQGYLDAECVCRPALHSPTSCMTPSEASPDCDPASGSRRSCPYRAVVGADLELRAHPGCKQLTAVANGLAGVHADLRRFLEAPQYPWQQFVVTILACPGAGGRLSDVTVGFPSAYRSQLGGAGLPADRDVLCRALRVYITNAEAQVLGGDSRLTHETLCLDDLVLSPVAHLARPRRPPPAAAPGARDAVHLWLGPAPKGVSVDLGQLVVKLYSVPSGLTATTPYSALHELNAEKLPAGQCVVEIEDKNETRTTAADNTTAASTTMSSMNFSSATGAMTADQMVTSTGSIFGIAVLLLLLAYCMCQRTAGGGDWESDSSWSESPASWTTSSTSSWTTTPSSSADGYSTESFDFERDAHLVGGRATLEYMRRVQEEALRRRRLQISHPGMVESD